MGSIDRLSSNSMLKDDNILARAASVHSITCLYGACVIASYELCKSGLEKTDMKVKERGESQTKFWSVEVPSLSLSGGV